MKIAAIVAMTPQRVIGKDNLIPWYLPADLKYFKRTTLGHPVVMGRNCFESIGKPLPKRTNVVLSRNPFFIASGIVRATSPEDALLDAKLAAEMEDKDKIFIIGGAEVYKLFWDQMDLLYLTEVHANVEGDVYFPEVDFKQWQLISEENHEPDAKNEFAYTFKVFEKKKA